MLWKLGTWQNFQQKVLYFLQQLQTQFTLSCDQDRPSLPCCIWNGSRIPVWRWNALGPDFRETRKNATFTDCVERNVEMSPPPHPAERSQTKCVSHWVRHPLPLCGSQWTLEPFTNFTIHISLPKDFWILLADQNGARLTRRFGSHRIDWPFRCE